jgi:hypothetical protein
VLCGTREPDLLQDIVSSVLVAEHRNNERAQRAKLA